MSTRGIYNFQNSANERPFRVYNHWDNYPEAAYEFIKNATAKAWCLPRFEADEFAAAFIAANKTNAGGCRLLHDEPEIDGISDMWQEYEYFIMPNKQGELVISVYYMEFDNEAEKAKRVLQFQGSMTEMRNHYPETKIS